MTSLNCVKNGFPASYSLQSVDILPSEDPGFVSLTLTSPPGEIRVVHGHQDLYNSISEVVESLTELGPSSIQDRGGVWIRRFERNDEDDTRIFGSYKGCLLACSILERLIVSGWEVITSTELSITPEFELCTWIFKRCTTPLYNGEVSCLAFDGDNKIKVVGKKPQIQINNVVRRAIQKKWPKGLLCDSSDNVPITLKKDDMDLKKNDGDMLEEIDRELKASRDGLDCIANEKDDQEKFADNKSVGKKYKTIQDDPECPGEFELWGSPWRPTNEKERIQSRLLMIELIHSLFCRQWKLVTTGGNLLSTSSNDLLFFCRDGRILPSIGGERGLAGVELERPDIIRLYNVKPESSLKTVIDKSWTAGLKSKEKSHEDVSTLYCNASPWKQNSLASRAVEPTIESRRLTLSLIKTMNANDYNLYGTVRLNRHDVNQSTLLIFKQSNISFTEGLCLQLSGQNKICIVGGGSEEKDVIRRVIEGRWPYPIVKDKILEESQTQYFKVKRYPWAFSYGNKDIDKIIQIATSLLPPKMAISFPKNTDSDSGKSAVLFALKELSSLGWRLITSMNSSSETIMAPCRRSVSQYCDPDSIYFMK